jgi:hypothetical protein
MATGRNMRREMTSPPPPLRATAAVAAGGATDLAPSTLCLRAGRRWENGVSLRQYMTASITISASALQDDMLNMVGNTCNRRHVGHSP